MEILLNNQIQFTEEADPAKELVPIREISRITGVNTVTLRAWERRYGLLKPGRTDKGHRLYSNADIQQVKNIQSWLVRGLAIGRVRAILEDKSDPAANVQHANIWHQHIDQLNTALHALNRRKLEVLLTDLIAVYPMEVIADQLLAPVVESMQVNRYAVATRREFLLQVLLEQFYAGQYRQRQNARGQRVTLFKLSAEESDILPQALNYSLLVNGYQAEYCGFVPTEEWIFAVDQLQPQLVILYSDSASRLAEVKHSLGSWQQVLKTPLLLSGRIVSALVANNEMATGRRLGVTLQQILKNLTTHFPLSEKATGTKHAGSNHGFENTVSESPASENPVSENPVSEKKKRHEQ